MTEKDQLDAVERELRAAGWKVNRDVVLDDSSLLAVDFLATRTEPGRVPGDPPFLVVEIANRRRSVSIEVRGVVQRMIADEEEAVRRIQAIGELLEGIDEREVGFQIRFLDVSADQAAARLLTTTSVYDDEALWLDLLRTARSVDAAEVLGARESAIVIAVAWCRWVRILGVRYPAAARRELIDADLRTIQKDLYDARIVETDPAMYFAAHRSVSALVEGGDVAWDDVIGLEEDLRRVLRHVAQRLDRADPFENRESATRDTRSRRPLYGEIEAAIRESLGEQEIGRLARGLDRLRLTDATPAYRQALIDFERDLGPAASTLNRYLPALRDLTDLIRG